MIREVATMMRSAGSTWNGSGSEADLMAMALSTGMNVIHGSRSDLFIQSATSMVSFNRSFATRRATSQVLIDEISIVSFSKALSRSFRARRERFSGLLTHQIQT